jgi:hypothetical protein
MILNNWEKYKGLQRSPLWLEGCDASVCQLYQPLHQLGLAATSPNTQLGFWAFVHTPHGHLAPRFTAQGSRWHNMGRRPLEIRLGDW